jgi:hypothetical protein
MRRLAGPYPFERGGRARVDIATPGTLADARVMVDGGLVHAFSSLEELRGGASVTLVDGSTLSVKLGRRYGSLLPGLDVRRDDRALPGSAFDPRRRVRLGAWTLVGAGAWGLLSLQKDPFANAFVFVQLGIFAGLAGLAWLGNRWLAFVVFVLGALVFTAAAALSASTQHWGYAALGLFCAWSLVGDARASLDLERRP